MTLNDSVSPHVHRSQSALMAARRVRPRWAEMGALSVSLLTACTPDSDSPASSKVSPTHEHDAATAQSASTSDATEDSTSTTAPESDGSDADTVGPEPSDSLDAASSDMTAASTPVVASDAPPTASNDNQGAGGVDGVDAQVPDPVSSGAGATDSGNGGTPPVVMPAGAVCDPNATYGAPLEGVTPLAGVVFEVLPDTDAGAGVGGLFGGAGGGGLPGGGGTQVADGPVWLANEGVFVFSRVDLPGEIWQVAPDAQESSVFAATGGGKGMTLDAQGRLVIADSSNLRISRIDLADPLLLNVLLDASFTPNDVVVRDDGNMYVTDNQSGLFHVTPSLEVVHVERASTSANGVTLALDQQHVFVSATSEQTITRFTLGADGSVDPASAQIVFITANGNANGLTLDCAGNFYVATNGGVEVFTKDGEPITLLSVAERGVNVAFGGEDHKTLFIASQGGLYMQRMGVPGLPN